MAGSWVPATPMITGESVVATLAALRDELAEIVVNGEPLGMRVQFDPGAPTAAPLAVIIVPPDFTYGAHGIDPTDATTDVYVLAPPDANVLLNLLSMALSVANCVDVNTRHAVDTSRPSTWADSDGTRPAYVVAIKLDLSPGED